MHEPIASVRTHRKSFESAANELFSQKLTIKLRKKISRKTKDLNLDYLSSAERLVGKLSDIINEIIRASVGTTMFLPWQRDFAVRLGLLASIGDLLKSLQKNSESHDGECVKILLRCIFDRAVTLFTLCRKPAEIESYIIHSLAFDKDIVDEMTSKGFPRDSSFEQEIFRSGISKGKIKRNNWNRGFWERQKLALHDIKPLMLLFSSANHQIHGNWSDIYNNYLFVHESYFSVSTKGRLPRTSEILCLVLVSISSAEEVMKIHKIKRGKSFLKKLTSLEKQAHKIAEKHRVKIAKKHSALGIKTSPPAPQR